MRVAANPALALFRAARAVGVALLVVAVVLLWLMPTTAGELAPGLRTPILALELARSRAEVEALFGPPGSPLRAELVRGFDVGNQIDFAFLVLYGAMLALAGLAFSRVAVAVLASFASVCDVLENLQLLAITHALGGQYDDALARLFVFTWLKWGALALAFSWLAPALLRGLRWERVLAGLSLLTGALAVGAFVDRAHFAEPFAWSITLAFLGLFVVCARRARVQSG